MLLAVEGCWGVEKGVARLDEGTECEDLHPWMCVAGKSKVRRFGCTIAFRSKLWESHGAS